MIGCRDFFLSCPLYFLRTHVSLLTIFVCFFILFHSCCSHARVFGKTFVHECCTFGCCKVSTFCCTISCSSGTSFFPTVLQHVYKREFDAKENSRIKLHRVGFVINIILNTDVKLHRVGFVINIILSTDVKLHRVGFAINFQRLVRIALLDLSCVSGVLYNMIMITTVVILRILSALLPLSHGNHSDMPGGHKSSIL